MRSSLPAIGLSFRTEDILADIEHAIGTPAPLRHCVHERALSSPPAAVRVQPAGYFPMQNREKIALSRSSTLVSPVMAPSL